MLPFGDFYEGRILNFAHRGASHLAPENTLPAFRLAAELGADGVELDIQLSADGVPVVIHDARLEATTNGKGPVSAWPVAALRQVDAGIGFSKRFAGTPIPTLAEAFEAIGRQLLVNVELKGLSTGPKMARAAVRVIREFEMQRRTVVSSFNPIALLHVRRMDPTIQVGHLYAPPSPLPRAISWLVRRMVGSHVACHPHFSMVSPRFMRWARHRGYRVNVWTVNEISDIERMRDLGVDMIMSDHPDRVREVLG